jgi:chitin synthase
MHIHFLSSSNLLPHPLADRYAFANLDDITWGTKGTDRDVPSDLGNVVQDSNSRIDLEIVPEAPNDLYVEALENLRTRKPLPRTPGGLSEGEKDQIRRDYYANLRTNVGTSHISPPYSRAN